MYEKFFGLVESPFGMAPDPRFLYRGTSHREALAALKYGVQENRGLLVLVGDAGTGKTTLVRALEEQLRRTTCCVAVTHTTIDSQELLPAIMLEIYATHRPELGREPGRKRGEPTVPRLSDLSRAELVDAFNRFVASESVAFDRLPLLIVDEAQNLSLEALEEVRLLSNVMGPRRKLLPVLLAGLPGLEDQLARPEADQIRQRVAIRARLEPLSLEETGEYVLQRLERAGSSDPFVFDADALGAIWQATKGVPRTINAICDIALVSAFAVGEAHVSRSLAEEAIRDLLEYPSVGPRMANVPLPAPDPLDGWLEAATAELRNAFSSIDAEREARRRAAVPDIEIALGHLEQERISLLDRLRSDTDQMHDVEAQIAHAKERLEKARGVLDRAAGSSELEGGGRAGARLAVTGVS